MKFSRQAPSPNEFVGALFSAISGGRYFKTIFAFEPRDVWVGVYWKATNNEYEYAKDFVRCTYRWRVNVYACLLPCCLIRFAVEFGVPRWKRGDMSDFNRGRDETNAHIARHRPLNLPADRAAMIERACAAEDGSISAGSVLVEKSQ